MRAPRPLAIGLVLALGGCAPATVSVASLARDPGAYEGQTITVAGPLETWVVSNAAACPTRPCNNVSLRLSAGAIVFVESDAYEGPVAEGYHPQTIWDDLYGPRELGCDGNDVEMVCAPAIPSAIVSVTGTVRDGSLIVDSVEVDGSAPATGTLSHFGSDITLRTVGR